MKMLKDKQLWACVLITVLAGWLSGLATLQAKEYYQSLTQPFFAPPAWLFGPVWTILYILMGVSLYLILRHNILVERRVMLWLFAAQFVFNLAWSSLFFTLKWLGISVLDAFLLWGSVALLCYYSWRHLRLNAIILLPYLLWVSYALVLNIAIAYLNR